VGSRPVSEHRYFAFLRAINTGGRRLTNERLLAPFRELGFTDVAAYQAAGNVTFHTDDTVDERRIESELATAYGFHTPTFVRSAAEIRATADLEPFSPTEIAATAGRVQVTFLRSRPSPDLIAALVDLAPEEDLVRVMGSEWYWLPVEGISASKLPVGQVESLLGEMTMRTLGTVARMSSKFAD
jgi:uncharacterized protein (DUF1697 family)